MAQVEAFLAVTEELHFGRAAQRLHVSQPRVSRLIAALERQAGGKLFERTSRKVSLTPLGQQLHAELRPGYEQMCAALDHARRTAREIAGQLRLGCLVTVGGPELTRLVEEFCARHPDCELAIHVIPTTDPYGPLRRGEVDIVMSWLAAGEPDLATGPPVMYRDRVLQVGLGHRLAARESVCVEDLAEEDVHDVPASFPAAIYDAIVPRFTPSGRPIRRTIPWESDEDVLTAVARGQIVHPGFGGQALTSRPDLAEIPIRDLPPMPFGPVWRTAHENARIRALAATARSTCPPPARRGSRAGPQPAG